MGFLYKIFSNSLPVKKHISRPQKKWALKSTWNPFKSQYPDLGRPNIPEWNISRKMCKNRNAMFLYMPWLPLLWTLTCSAHAPSLKVRGEVNPHSANLHGLPKSFRSEVQNGYWWPTLGITLQCKWNLATAAGKKNRFYTALHDVPYLL